MPKVPAYTLAWSPSIQAYELYETRHRELSSIVPDNAEWFAWLDRASSFAFSGKRGHFTARKESKKRGGQYWYAYLTTGERLAKKYLGKSVDITLAQLEHIAGIFHTQGETGIPPPISPAGNAGIDTAERAWVAGQIHPLNRVLATKLRVPRLRAHLVLRSHLIERLQQEVVERALTLVSAPAGFGKTTLLAQWLADRDMTVAWVSLEAEDNDPSRFLSYIIASLQSLNPQIGTTTVALLHTPQPPSPEAVLAVLVNELTEREGGDFTLVLDDYHTITSEPVHRGMTFLIEHLPPQMHLILATRADPPLPLARLRARGQICEVRTADLRFGSGEVSAFLQTVMGLDLPPDDIALIKDRTEGWITGLQLAALSLHGRADVSGFLAAFAGTHRFVLDYLSEEILSQQSAQVMAFLLHTCILERLSGPLCDAVTEQEGSQAMLEGIEKANLFVVSLDDERHWYRYHHLFAEVLRSRLQQAEPRLLPILHHRASSWYEQHDLPGEAVYHALAIPDVELAARLIEPIMLPLTFQGQISTVLDWIHALPDELVRSRPFLSMYYARLLMYTNQLEAAESRVQEIERRLVEEMPTTSIIQGWVFSTLAGIAGLSGHTTRAIALARRALELLPESETIPRIGATIIVARAYEVNGDVTRAVEHEAAAAVSLIRSSHSPFAIVSGITLLARMHVLQGRLRQAEAVYAQLTQALPVPEVLQTLFTSFHYYFGLGDLLREWNQLDAAERHLAQGMALVKETLTMEPFIAVLGYTTLARLQQAKGNIPAAFAALDGLAQLAKQRNFAPHLMTQEAALRAQLHLAQGNIAAASAWADNCGLSADDEELSYPREVEYLSLAKVRIAQARANPSTPFLQDILHLLARLLLEAERKARTGSVLEILITRSLALEAQADLAGSLSTLERALLLAEPERYIRLFVDEGAPMLASLRHISARRVAPGYVATLLSSFNRQQDAPVSLTTAHPALQVHSLTRRERDVLELLLEGASNREIARRLVLSVNTVKRHVYNICGKLGAQNRVQAIIRARELPF